ncbi:T9SS type A sorting domain-containing protein [Winogradskyella flava]|uniref:Por secretion system C-terminal sorting domain-containing protein n=1 Tax=Winogradskyella flava TaxID=1884876 RepID=A0A842IWP2_9FLAO|nr:T9SS type A sorting domain-containing protein [Winogradskyella flava]MBC2846539.1 hypothetical protein [Winogradskyella flava]
MRNFLTLFTIISSICFGYSQTKDELQEPNIDSMLVNIDKTHLTSSFLYERTTPISNLTSFNSEDKNIAVLSYFEQALQELYKSSNKNKFMSYKNARKFYKKSEDLTTVNIGVISAKLNSINYNPVDESKGALHFENNTFTRRNDNPAFLEHDILVISPLLDFAHGNELTYTFDSNLWFEDNVDEIKSISANFGTNQDYLIYENGNYQRKSLKISYDETGYKTLKFVVTYTNGTKKTTYGKLHVKLKNQYQQLRNDPLIENVEEFTCTIPFQGYDESAPICGEIDFRIFYHTNNGNTQPTLLKPIVIIDGFDPGDKRKIQDSDSDLPNDMHFSIEEFMVYDNGQPLIPTLRNLGYDVVLVNHPTYERNGVTIDGGADYIERNAMNHIALYNYLNGKLEDNNSDEELVIVGPSMGGQISRYALAYMEKYNIDHNTRLWVSVDSPHLGANIPLGIQSMINLLDVFGDSVAAQDFYYDQLKSTAANQQLIEQHKSGHSSDYQNGGSPVYQEYYSRLFSNGLPGSNGYPQNLRKIAIVNGSLNGINLGREGTEDFRIHGFADQLWWDTKIAEMNTKYMPKSGQHQQLARLWRLFKPLRTASYTNINPNGSMDNVPGGYYNSEDQIHAAVMGDNPDIFGFNNGISFGNVLGAYGFALLGIHGDHFESRTNKKIHSFIPTVSALGFYNSDFNWGNSLNRNLLCDNEIPFDSYFGPSRNERHTSFTKASKDWLLEELAENPQDPHFPFDARRLSGSSSLCYFEVETYSFDECKVPGDVVNWEVSNSLQMLDNTGTTITVKATNLSSVGWIKATFNNGIEIIKDLSLGAQRPIIYGEDGEQEATFSFCTDHYGNINFTTPSSALEWDWNIVSGDFNMLATNNRAQFFSYRPTSGIVTVRARGNCGWSVPTFLVIQFTNCSDDGGFTNFRVAQNPVRSDILEIIETEERQSNLNITSQDENNDKGKNSNTMVTMEFYDFSGNLLKTQKDNRNQLDGKYNLNLSRFPNGKYFIKIIHDKIEEIHQVILDK